MRNYAVLFIYHPFLRIALLISILSLLIGGSVAMVKNMAMNVNAADHSQLTYRSITVSTGDTLWSVAKENYTQEWGSISHYLEEIKRCNALTSEDITAGSSLIVPVYLPLESNSIDTGADFGN